MPLFEVQRSDRELAIEGTDWDNIQWSCLGLIEANSVEAATAAVRAAGLPRRHRLLSPRGGYRDVAAARAALLDGRNAYHDGSLEIRTAVEMAAIPGWPVRHLSHKPRPEFQGVYLAE